MDGLPAAPDAAGAGAGGAPPPPKRPRADAGGVDVTPVDLSAALPAAALLASTLSALGGAAPPPPPPSSAALGASLAGAVRAPFEAALAGPAPVRERRLPPSARGPPAAAAPAAADSRAALASALAALEAAAAGEGDGDEGEQPPGLAVALLPHQRTALAWAVAREAPGARPRGGLLADDQGLGKTVTAAALIARAPRGPGEEGGGGDEECDAASVDLPPGAPSGGTLIVVPTTLLEQWLRELQEKLGGGGDQPRPVARRHHGANRTGDEAVLAEADVVVTTYGTLERDVVQGEAAKAAPAKAATPPPGDTPPPPSPHPEPSGPLLRVRWGRVILDEAHTVRNARTRAARAATALAARSRFCLTGTPIVNGAADLQSLFAFLRHAPYSAAPAFKSLISDPLDRGDAAGGARLRAALQGVALRRVKQTAAVGVGGSGGPGMAPRAVCGAARSPSPGPLTLPSRTTTTLMIDLTPAERAKYDALARVAARALGCGGDGAALGGGGARVPAPPTAAAPSVVHMLTLLLRLRQACDHPDLPRGRRAGGATAGAPPARAEAAAAAALAPRVRAALLATLDAGDQACAACGDAPDEAAVTPCRHVYCRQCAAAEFGGGSGGARDASGASAPPLPPRRCRACRVPVPPCGAMCRAALAPEAAGGVGRGAPSDAPPEPAPDAAPASAKLAALTALLTTLAARNAAAAAAEGAVPEKAVVFSQWTAALDLCAAALTAAGVATTRVDGTMPPPARDAAVAAFQDPASGTDVMLASLKAAGLGLNLTAASHVVLLDAWWARAAEEQAVDRAHRIGQTRDVAVTRLIARGTVEERVVALADRKAGVAAAAFAGGAGGGGGGGLTKADLAFLFG